MSLTSSRDDKEFVRVICDFTYTPKDASDSVSIAVGEEYWLIDRTNSEWWYVQKNKSKTRLFIPAKYVEISRKGGRPEDNNTLINGNPVTRPKPITSDRITSYVPTTAAKDETRQRLTRKPSETETLPPTQQGKPCYENVVLTGQQSRRVTEKSSGQATVKQPGGKKDNDIDGKTGGTTTAATQQERIAAEKSAVDSAAQRNEMRAEASSVAEDGTASGVGEFHPGKVGHVALDNHQQRAGDRVVAAIVSAGNREGNDIADGGIEIKDDVDKPTVLSTSKQELPSKAAGKAGGVGMTSSEYANIDDLRKLIQFQLRDVTNGNYEKSTDSKVPLGWTVEEEEGEKTFVNNSKGEKWKTAFDESGRQYFYSLLTNQTVWNLAEAASESGKGSHSVEGRIDPDFDKDVPHLEPLPLKMVQKQGPLSKAKVDDQGKKAKKPSWSQSYAVLVENIVYFYKDMKIAASAKAKSISSLGKPELTLQLDDAKLSSSPDEKRKEILMLSLSNGVVYLLHHEDEDVLQHWRQSFENNIEAIKTTPVTTSSGSKEIENLPVRPELSRMCSNSSIISEERTKVADRLLHWFKRRPSLEVLQLKGIIKDAVFGSSLTAICEREKTKIPRFVHACLAAVEKRGLDVDGIYRISGNMSLVQKLRLIVDQNEFYDLLCPTWDVHTITGALKLFFRELSEPVFTFALFDKFLDAYRITDHAQKISAYREVIRRLPPFHAETMKRLFKHLTEVIRHGSANRMQSQALAIVFGPTLLWPESKSKDVTLAASMVYQGQVVEFMIIEFKSIFS